MLEITETGVSQAQELFVQILPELESRAAVAFRHLDAEAREEACAETLALSWKNFLHCGAQRKYVAASSVSHYAVLAVRNGRSLCGQSSTDVLAERTRILERTCVCSVDGAPAAGTAGVEQDGWWDRSQTLVDKRLWERPFERVRLRHDYGAFLALPRITRQERKVFNLLAEGNRTGEIARLLCVKPPRICQLKNSLAQKLIEFMGPDIRPARRTASGLKCPEEESHGRGR